ncbi:1-acyl-sn-glycerol-3-phosphate acyltransferase [Hamadaea flava]|uniref:Glycosyltransferase n=1 Tax=Hamadaea flava TaxID=1742688 RepID=A0ABV8LY66_9ACTN|nr:glycosyltransferase [Hamadaea flava]MCP2324723.1 1-acyl-sn-glycerol-3-phosphate acyltransferase [Hamadaea flava]
MIITLVIDTFNINNNGTTMSATRFAAALLARGHTVRVVTCGEPGEPGDPGDPAEPGDPALDGLEVFYLPELVVPIASRLAHRQNTLFAKPDREVLTTAVKGADVVHIYQPWALGRAAERIARELGVPAIAAFHIQPENVTYNIGLGWFRPAAHLVYLLLRLTFYGRFADIHCPSTFIAAQLRRHGYRARLHVISNGVDPAFRPFRSFPPDRVSSAGGPGPPASVGSSGSLGSSGSGGSEPFRILMVGRFSPEKRQDVLIRAVRRARHADRVQVCFAGHGPTEKRLRRLAAKLPIPARFGYYAQDELIDLIRTCDLYVHASDVEIEGLSCMEAFSCGLVPVISDSPRSATGQFALSPENLFSAGDPASLADRIDYWIEHPAARAAASAAYAQLGDLYEVDRSIKAIERVYAKAGDPPENPAGYAHWPYRLAAIAFYYAIAIPALFVWTRLLLGVRAERRTGTRPTGGALTVCNHVHFLDSALVAIAVFPRRIVVTSAPINLENRWYGWLVRLLGGIAVPTELSKLPLFFGELELFLAMGRLVHFFPEGELEPYNTALRPFKRGAFHLAAQARVPIVPLSIRFTEPTGLDRLFRRKPTMVVVRGEPIAPTETDPHSDEAIRQELARRHMTAFTTHLSADNGRSDTPR